jgi:hypothetical protein
MQKFFVSQIRNELDGLDYSPKGADGSELLGLGFFLRISFSLL